MIEKPSARDKWVVFQGTELEGRLTGEPTLFFERIPEKGFQSYHNNPILHWFFNRKFLKRHGYAAVIDALDMGKKVSVECDHDQIGQMPDRVRQDCHIICAVTVEDFIAQLKPTDDVRLDFAPFDCGLVNVSQLQRVTPSQYLADEVLETTRLRSSKV